MNKYIVDLPHALSAADVITALDSSESGMSTKSAEERMSVYGPNALKSKKGNTKTKIFLGQFLSPLIFILLGSAILTFFLKEYLNTIVILVAVFINVLLGFYQEYKAEEAIAKLNSYIKERAIVLRDGSEMEIDSSSIVLGDIIKLTYGSRVPADVRLVLINALKIDESILTGESMPVAKTIEPLDAGKSLPERTNMAYAGTLVVDGFAHGIVTSIASETQIGKITDLVGSNTHAQTPLQKSISSFAWFVFMVTILFVVLIFVLGVSRGQDVVSMLLLSLAVAVAVVPEALPIVTTVILSIGSQKIAKSGGVVRSLSASETLGSATLIMTDKTGTLTAGDMELVNIFSLDEILVGKEEPLHEPSDFLKQKINILEYAIKNIDVVVENPSDAITDWKFAGRVLERNVAKVARTLAPEALRENFTYSTNTVVPFSSKHKFSVVLDKGEFVAMGAPDILALRSSMDKNIYDKILNKIDQASVDGMRLVAVAVKKYNGSDFDLESEKDLDFIGLLAFRDPLRPEVKQAIIDIENLGTKLVIITGDLPGTALALTREIGSGIQDRNHIA